MTPNIQFTKNFSLHELISSQAATRLNISQQFNPPESVIKNLEALCVNVLQPLRDAIRQPLQISSGYRCPEVNKSIGGATNSQHLTGQAADIQCFALGNEKLFKKIVSLQLPFDQMINEFNYAWVHVSYNADRNRMAMLEAFKNENNQTQYRTLTV